MPCLFQELVLPALALCLQPVQRLANVVDLVLDELDRVDLVLDGDHVPLHLAHLALTRLHADREHSFRQRVPDP